MPETDSPAIIVARFLKANHYDETLNAFIREAGLSPDAGDTGPGDWTIEKIIEEKKQYDASIQFERKGNEGSQGWSSPAPSVPLAPPDLGSLSNILHVNASPKTNRLFITGADRNWHTVSVSSPYRLLRSESDLQGSPILSALTLGRGEYMLSTSMSGQVMLHQTATGTVVDRRRDHAKYAVQVTAAAYGEPNRGGWVIATAAWDQKVHIYHSYLDQGQDSESAANGTSSASMTFFGEPIHTITLASNPESIVLVRHPDTGVLHLIVSRRDSTHILYFSITTDASNTSSSSASLLVQPTGKQNLAPHSNAWVAFTPSHMSICPTDSTLLAVATSHLPHMKLILVRLLFPSDSSSPLANSSSSPPPQLTQASFARAALALQDREDAAIRLQVSTLAPQTPYSTPQVVWRPDGSGVWVNGDDGAVRGIEVQTGKVICTLKGGHEAGTKVRTLWAGRVRRKIEQDEDEEDAEDEEDRKEGGAAWREILVSGGFDKKVLVWSVKEGEEDGSGGGD